MSEVTSALTVFDLVKEIAKAAEIAYYGTTGQEEALPPVDVHDLDRCLRVLNHAIRDFIGKAPPGGWRWRDRLMQVNLVPGFTGTASAGSATSLTDAVIAGDYADNYFNGYVLRITDGTGKNQYATVTDYTGASGVFAFSGGLSGGATPDTTSNYRICRSTQVVDSDPARYLLTPDFQGEYTGEITFIEASYIRGIRWVSESEIRRNRELYVWRGHVPVLAAIRPYGSTGTTQRQWELIVDPQPTQEKTITFPYKANFDKLNLLIGTATGGGTTSLTDSSLAGKYPDNYFNGQTIRIMSGTGKTSYAICTDYTGVSGVFTVADWLYQNGAAAGTDPAVGSVYYLDAGEVHPAGLQFDFAIMSACLAQTELEFTDVKRGFMDKFLQIDLPAAYAIDGRSAPHKMGPMKSGTGNRLVRFMRDAVIYENGS